MDNVNQQIPPAPTQPPVKTSSNLSFVKALAYGFVIVSIGISIAIGGYLLGANKSKLQPVAKSSVIPSLTPTPDPTANWKTYTNTEYSFLFKYPLDSKVAGNLADKSTLIIVSNIWGKKGIIESSDYFNMFLKIFTVDKNINFKDWIIQNSDGLRSDGITKSITSGISGEITPYDIGGLEGLSFLGGTDTISKYVYIKKGAQIFEFVITGLQTGSSYADNKDAENIMNQILSTFKSTP